MATMVAAGPARWDVTADPIRPQNSQAKGGPSSTVPVPVPAAAATAAAGPCACVDAKRAGHWAGPRKSLANGRVTGGRG